MKKIIGILLLLVVLVLLVGPYMGGMKAEKELRNFADVLNGWPGYNAEWETYERGWFTTEAVLVVSLDPALFADAELDLSNAQLPLHIDLHHGPLLLQETGSTGWYSWQVNLDEETAAWLEQHVTKSTDAPLYYAEGHMGLTGAIGFRDALQAFSVTGEDGSVVARSEGYSGSGSVDSSRQLTYKGVLRTTDFTAEDMLLAVGNTTITTNGDLSRLDWDTFLYPSDFELNISSLHLQGHEGAVDMTDLVFEGVVEMPSDEDWFTMIATFSLANLQAAEVELSNAAMTFAYERISTAAYKAYLDTVASMGAEEMADYSEFFTPDVLQAFFANDPAFVLRNLSFSMPEGDFKGDFSLSLAEGFTMADEVPNPMVLFQALVFDANVQVDRPLAIYLAGRSAQADAEAAVGADPDATAADIDAAAQQQAEATIQTLVQQGILVEDSEELRLALQFLDGQLLMNGNPMPFPLGMLLGGQQGQPMPQGQPLPQSQPMPQ